ncbi:recombination protein NinG [Psychrobacter pygoscelis]|uniref:recombination protein NinG n=1 Tax=Psychrobacter pygoscelis TaxID=2488563 RepID=UPI00103EE822|nr:recombination protein NinG [Psychrobacter pygoscelis]
MTSFYKYKDMPGTKQINHDIDAKARSKRLAKRKPKTPAKLANECAVDLQLLVRLKAADSDGNCQCVSCGAIKHWSEMQGGHYVGRGVSATKLLEENINPQCRRCNIRATESHVGYTLHMIETYGVDFIKHLRQMMTEVKKWRKTEILELHEDIKRQIAEQKTRLGVGL